MKNAIYPIKEKIKIMYDHENIELPKEEKEAIEKHWKKELEKNPHLFRGNLVTVVDIYKNQEEEIKIICKKTDYAHFMYEKENKEIPSKCCSMWAGNLVETSDHHYILGRMTSKTANPREN